MRQWKFTIAFAICVLTIPAASASGSSGTWERAWGKDVVAIGGVGFEICTTAVFCTEGSDTTALGGELDSPEGPAVDAAGNLYVADKFNTRVQVFDSQGNFLRAWGKDVDALQAGTGFEICTVAANCKDGAPGGLGGEFNGVQAVAVDGAGNVYTAEIGRIQKFTSAGTFLSAWGRNVDAVQAGTGFEICTVAANCQAGSPGGLGGEFNDIDGIAADGAGNVYVADTANLRIQKLASNGAFLRAWGKDVVNGGGVGFEICTVAANCKAGAFGTLGGEGSARGVAVDGAGNVYTADAGQSRIQKFDSQGNFLRTWGKDVDAVQAGTGFEICTVAANCKQGNGVGVGLGGELDSPEGIAADAAGNVYVTDTSNQRVQKFDAQGNFLSAWGSDVDISGGVEPEICTVAANCKADTVGGLGGEFDEPEGAAVDASGNVYVADSDNERIQKFRGDPVPDPVPPVVNPPRGDPELKVAAKAKQKLKKLAVNVGCGGDTCDVKATGKVKLKQDRTKKSFSLKPGSVDVAAGATEKLRLKLSKKQARVAAKLLDNGGKGKAAVKVEAVVGAVKLTESVRIALKG